MGDLADAIREHLELKRRRGADPAEVAREEHEALAPVTRSHPVVVASDLYEPEDEDDAGERRDVHEFAVQSAVTSTRPHATVELRPPGGRRAVPAPGVAPEQRPRPAAPPPMAPHADDADATQEFRVERNGIWLADDD